MGNCESNVEGCYTLTPHAHMPASIRDWKPKPSEILEAATKEARIVLESLGFSYDGMTKEQRLINELSYLEDLMEEIEGETIYAQF